MSRPITVVIVGGDPVVDAAIDQLLQGAGYRTRFLTEPFTDVLGDPLLGAHLLLLTPGAKRELRQAVLVSGLAGKLGGRRVSVLELVTALGEMSGDGHDRFVPWPCRTVELKRRIEAALVD